MILNEELIMSKPMVSISMLTYNHEKYIEQAINSVLMQKTNFDYQLIIGEDCSSDGTREIVIDYAKRYPKKIIAILHEENEGIKSNVLAVRQFLKGNYIAILEGDDYWIDCNKLQRQVDFLESHKDFLGVSHNHIDVKDNGEEITGLKGIELKSGYMRGNVYDLSEVGKCFLAGHTSTLMYRKFFCMLNKEQIENYDNCDVIGDKKLNLILAYLGGVYKLPQVMSAYRHHDVSWTEKRFIGGLAYYSYQSISQLESLAYKMFNIQIDFEPGKLRLWYGTCVEFVKSINLDNFRAVCHIYQEGNKLKKILYLFTHTAYSIVNKYVKRRNK